MLINNTLLLFYMKIRDFFAGFFSMVVSLVGMTIIFEIIMGFIDSGDPHNIFSVIYACLYLIISGLVITHDSSDNQSIYIIGAVTGWLLCSGCLAILLFALSNFT